MIVNIVRNRLDLPAIIMFLRSRFGTRRLPSARNVQKQQKKANLTTVVEKGRERGEKGERRAKRSSCGVCYCSVHFLYIFKLLIGCLYIGCVEVFIDSYFQILPARIINSLKSLETYLICVPACQYV